MRSEEEKLAKVESLLRQQPGSELSPYFKQKVMAEVRSLPAPGLITPPSARRGFGYALSLLSGGEKVLAAVLLLAAAAMMFPGTGEALGALNWQLSGLSVDLAIGETALSLSLITVLSVGLGLAITVFLSAVSGRQRLIGI